MNCPLVSVITNSYNSVKYLRANIESMLQQDYDNWEHIIVDCGSTDGSADLVRSMGHPRLRLCEASFCSVSEGRNIGIAESKGEIISILDSDDAALPHRLSRQVEVMVNRPDVVAVGGGIIRVEERTGARKKFTYPNDHRTIMLLLETCINPVPHSTLAFRRACFDGASFYSTTMRRSEDFELILRLARKGRLVCLAEPLAYYNYRLDSHSFRSEPGTRIELFYALKAVLLHHSEAAGDKLSPAQVERWLESIGPSGIRAIVGRRAFTTAMRNLGSLDVRTLVILLKTAAMHSRDIIGNLGGKWWKNAGTLESMAMMCLNNGEAK